MKIHRFIDKFDFSKNKIEITNPEIINQIKLVLRLKKGEIIILSDGKGKSIEVTLDTINPNKIICIPNKGNSTVKNDTENKKVNLYLAILKKENFELSVQKAVEVGVSKIIPVITERTIKTGLNVIRLEKIIKEASEQCGRDILPTLSNISKFEDALKDGENSEEKIIFHIDKNINNNFYTPNKKAKTSSIFIGPEGGFTENEIKLAKNLNYKISSLGSLTLRGETAAIVATYRAVEGI
ncbi:MAG: 16S rRNA (uracil(1498)-N(3))-methyltransferase [Burkholderiales bacterium]|nr:16S rRNA (uracil(1498)-N(3))-methyltransferase [Burkholderiales bacterium]